MTALARPDLERFLRALAARVTCPVRVVLTGGCEAMLLGGVRPTGDVDFGLVLRGRAVEHRDGIEAAIAAASSETGVPVQYSTDIDRWSSIAIPPRRQKTTPFERLGRVSVHLLAVDCWAVYKLARYLESDVADLVTVLRRRPLPARSLARLCGECLRFSPRSSVLAAFRRQVEHFFTAHGRRVWGARYDEALALRTFRRAAGIPGASRGGPSS